MWKYIGKDECMNFLLSLHLINVSDKKKHIKILYSIANNAKKNYKVFKIKKRNGKLRTIYEPNDILKHIQKQILNNILNNKSISKYATAYHKGISLKDNASPHLNKKIILKLDIKDFFESIEFVDIYNSCFPMEYFPKSIGMLLTYLCTYDDHLVQGAVTSPYISNLVMKEFDEVIGKYCESNNITYSRYSDDMTFSGDFNVSMLIKYVKRYLSKLSLRLNTSKTCVIRNSNSQTVTGIVVNEKVQVSNAYRKKIRQEVYYIKKYGITSHLKKKGINIDEKKYLSSLYGKVCFILQINDKDKEFKVYQKYLKNIIKEY